MHKGVVMGFVSAVLLALASGAYADPQVMGGGMGGMGGRGSGRPGSGPSIDPGGGSETQVHDEKPEIAAKKAFAAGMKSLDKARGYAAQAAQAQGTDKRAKAQEKANEAYYKAIDQFTEALSNKGDFADAWRETGYVHLQIGAYAEAFDDYNHVLKLQPDSLEAVESRAEALLHLDRLDDVKIAYMDLFNHDRERAQQLMRAMQQWVASHRADPQGMRPASVDGFAHWVEERLSAAGP